MPSPARSDERGQAAVELALGFPLVCLCLLLLVQLVVVVRAQVAVVHAAREAARAAAVSADPVGDGTAAGRAALWSGAGAASITIRASPATVRAIVQVRVATDVPLVGALVPDVEVSSEAVMQTEP
jgi:Flp pilus assembly protein TadG